MNIKIINEMQSPNIINLHGNSDALYGKEIDLKYRIGFIIYPPIVSIYPPIVSIK